MFHRFTYCIGLLVVALHGLAQQRLSLEGSNWQFRKAGTETWWPAMVPGCVHTDLMAIRQIPDPYLAENETAVQWVEQEDWEYQTEFIASDSLLKWRHLQLCFEGLDTYADVYLNDVLVLKADNMFRAWKVDLKGQLKKGKNTLRIYFASAVKQGKTKAKELSYTLPGDEKVFTRKAQYQYGWDWGPRLVTCGVWKPFYIEAWESFRINSVQYIQKQLSDAEAKLLVVTEIESDSIQRAIRSFRTRGPENLMEETTLIDLKKGVQRDTFVFTIPQPRRWWTNGLGDAYLYTMVLSLKTNKHDLVQHATKLGLRTLELVREPDLFGGSFYFKLNGVPVFMKGANYIPPDNFLTRTQSWYYDNLVRSAHSANMNMLRVWGGGVYADDAFYEACDEMGILVWQDFMFACSMYPGDDGYQKNVMQEATEQIVRLRNHASLALWCGNNEVQEGWDNWGWQKQYQYSKADSTEIANNNTVLFNDLLAMTVADYDPARGKNYIASSPQIGWGHKESLLQGDAHYWGVWWGMEPFGVYEKKVGRFMSEYGFQGLPPLATWKETCGDITLTSPCFLAHQKHATGYKTIATYMERDYKTPTEIAQYIYVSQLLQARGMQIAMEAHRRAQPYCMGTLLWQLNDCWPVTSWSMMDYRHRPKALYYRTKELFKPQILSITQEQEVYRVYGISDSLKETKGTLKLALLNFKGDTLFRKIVPATMAANTSSVLMEIPVNELPAFDSAAVYLAARFVSGKPTSDLTKLYFFVSPKALKLPAPMLKMKLNKRKGTITVQSKTFVKDLFIDLQKDFRYPGENFLDLQPGEKKQIQITPYLYNKSDRKLHLHWTSLYSINTEH